MESDEKYFFKWMKVFIYGGLTIAFVLAVVFGINQYYNCSSPVDTAIFGTYGDFIGGILGTIVAFYSAYLLIKTFINQTVVNKSVVAANIKAEAASERQAYQTELQLFDNKFRSFLDVYYKALDGYSSDTEKGRQAFEKEVQQFINSDFENHNDYKRRCDSATNEYLNFYSDHRVEMSVHLRVLYLLVSFIANSELEEEDKVLYAKLIRGQMSDAEMLIVRYNCCSNLGKKMQEYCNQFNLIKHLPIFSLLEMKQYRKKVEDGVDEKQAREVVNGLNAMFIAIRKKCVTLLYEGNPITEQFETSHNYTINLSTNENRTTFIIELKKKNNSRRGGGARVSSDEKGLDKLSSPDIQCLLRGFAYEMFVFSNFGLYNDGVQIPLPNLTGSDEYGYTCTANITNSKRLVLSYIQLQQRDNPIGNIEN